MNTKRQVKQKSERFEITAAITKMHFMAMVLLY